MEVECGKNPKIQCRFCPYSTFYSHTINSHILRRHPNYCLQCSYCDYKTSFQISIDNHIKKYHCPEQPQVQCPQCDFKASQVDIDKHVKKQHRPPVPRRRQCPYCDYKAHFNYRIKQHVRKMHPNKPVLLSTQHPKSTKQMKEMERLDEERAKLINKTDHAESFFL